MTKTRPPAVAGMFYPGSSTEINNMIDSFFVRVEEDSNFKKFTKNFIENKKQLHGLIVPHAGYVYSGHVAAYGFSLLKKFIENKLKQKKKKINKIKIVLLGPCHQFYTTNACFDENDYWKTPLGNVKLAKEKAKEIVEKKKYKGLFVIEPDAHKQEHCLEVQIPFLQTIFDKLKIEGVEFEIVPILFGDLNIHSIREISKTLFENYNDCFFIVSTDLSHYQPQETAEQLDKTTIDIIKNKDTTKANQIDACGKIPILIAMDMCKTNNLDFELLRYATSGDESGDFSRVVGYACFVF